MIYKVTVIFFSINIFIAAQKECPFAMKCSVELTETSKESTYTFRDLGPFD